MELTPLQNFFYRYIARRPYKGPVKNFLLFLAHVGKDPASGSVHITTRSLKHLFDKKPAEEFHFILDHLHLLLTYPDRIYQNKSGKRGNLCLVKRIKGHEYFCSMEKVSANEFQIATSFRLRDSDYIKDYTLLWNRGSGKPHRHAIEFPGEPIDAPQ